MSALGLKLELEIRKKCDGTKVWEDFGLTLVSVSSKEVKMSTRRGFKITTGSNIS